MDGGRYRWLEPIEEPEPAPEPEPKSNGKKPKANGFDKREYQKKYMAARRAQQKAAQARACAEKTNEQPA
jgi:hypothetical protein